MNDETGSGGEGRSRRDAISDLQARVEAALEEVRPKIKRALEELDAKVDAAVDELKPRAQSAREKVQPKIDQYVADIQPRLDSLLERLQAKINELRRDLDARAERQRGPDEPVGPAGQITPPQSSPPPGVDDPSI